MKRCTTLVLGCMIVGLVWFGAGCQTSPAKEADQGQEDVESTPSPEPTASVSSPAGETIALRCQYHPGDVETVRYTSEVLYKSWVEMPNKAPSQSSQRNNKLELLMQREIESVEPDGTAVMNVTIQEAHLTVDVETPRNNKKNEYHSTKEKTESTALNQPALAGVSYRIRIAPDTTVTEIMEAEALRKQLNVAGSAKNLVDIVLSDKAIRKIHEREFVQALPGEVQIGQTYEKLLPLPDEMIKAKAVEKTFQVNLSESSSEGNILSIDISGEPVHTLPSGFPATEEPTELPKQMIKTSSDMQNLEITGHGEFDAGVGRVLGETGSVECMLALFEENLMEKPKKEEYGVMFTQIKIDNDFEVVK